MRPQILVVHADPWVAGMLAELLAEEGYETLPHSTIEGAQHAVQPSRSALAIIDLEFESRKPSWSFASRIRSDPATEHLPIVALTTSPYAVPPRPPNCVEACEIVAEPFEVDEILAAVRALAGGN
jgi:DNA-binding response OmpR family regulator